MTESTPAGVLYRDSRFLDHDTGPHPESADRLRSIHAYLNAHPELLAGWEQRTAVSSDVAPIHAMHDEHYLQSIASLAEQGGGRADADTVVSPASYDVARLAVGTAIDAVKQVLNQNFARAVCLTRPPGHHALKNRAMGFCLINNVAVAARFAVDQFQLNRVLIVDWDVHHGNGTQDLFYEDDRVFFLSAHRWPFYPGTGDASETGHGAGLGATFNLPLQFGIDRDEYHERFSRILEDAASQCQPELVLISAGFDAHHADPVGSLGLETEDFARLTDVVQEVADQYCQGRIVSLLEGGYNVDALAESVAVHLQALST